MPFAPRPYTVAIAQQELDDLNTRIDLARWPERETVDDWQQGVPLAEARRVVDYWRNSYDWRRCEDHLNSRPNFLVAIDGLDIHYIHVRSPHADALPMIMTHGWPGSVIEFLKVIDPLVDPTAHGGSADQAFHLVIPSLPGYGFSGKPGQTGWGVEQTAKAWAKLMRGLGYDRYIAQGGDWGAAVTSTMALQKPDGLAAIHLNMMVGGPSEAQLADLTEDEKTKLARMQHWGLMERGYSEEQATKPQTLGYSLVDSPVGQAMWIYEKFHGWTDRHSESPADCFSLDEILDNIMVYWLTGSGASSARMYWESLRKWPSEMNDLPTAYSAFPGEIFVPSRRWADNRHSNFIYWGEVEKGGHFAAFEQPDLFVTELRKAMAPIR